MNYLKSLLLFLGGSIILSLVITLFNYFDLISFKVLNLLMAIMLVLLAFIISLRLGFTTKMKGYLTGLIFGGVISFIKLIFSFIFKSFSFNTLVIILFLIIFSVIGSIIGINFKKDKR